MMMNFLDLTIMSYKYIITESQNDRILNLIKQFAETYVEGQIVKTEVEVEYDSRRKLYVLHPFFHVKNRGRFPRDVYKHALAQYVENMVGVPVHTSSARVKEYSNPAP